MIADFRRYINKHIIKGILAQKIGRKIFASHFGKKWTAQKLGRFLPFLSKEDKILDIGCGNALIAASLKSKGYQIQAIDVANLAYTDAISVQIYDGETLPFAEKSVDIALLLTVLHHTAQPEKVLAEATRVAQKIIIIEDIYDNIFQQYLTYFMDTLVNMGFSKMTYQNKNDKQWKNLFEKMGLKVKYEKHENVLFFFTQVTYFLEISQIADNQTFKYI